MNKCKAIVWLQVTAGQGPKECGWVVAQVCRVFLQEAQRLNVRAEVIEQVAYDKLLRKQGLIEPDAFLSVLVRVEGADVESFCRRWAGTVKWKGESPYRPKHKRQNWFVAVQRVSVAGSEMMDIGQLQRQVSFDAMRSKGPGGQHVNKTSSAIRATHLPTGIQVRVDTDRSQHRNKQFALERLQLMLGSESEAKLKQDVKDRWLKHYQVGRGDPVRTFFGPEFECQDFIGAT